MLGLLLLALLEELPVGENNSSAFALYGSNNASFLVVLVPCNQCSLLFLIRMTKQKRRRTE